MKLDAQISSPVQNTAVRPELDDEPSVIGGAPSPIPTDEEHKAAWRAEYIRAFVEVGLDEETPAAWFDDLDWDEVKSQDPREAAEEEMQYWEAE